METESLVQEVGIGLGFLLTQLHMLGKGIKGKELMFTDGLFSYGELIAFNQWPSPELLHMKSSWQSETLGGFFQESAPEAPPSPNFLGSKLCWPLYPSIPYGRWGTETLRGYGGG